MRSGLSVRSYRSMAGGPKCLSHALLGACQDVAAGSHGATNQNRLTSQLIVKNK